MNPKSDVQKVTNPEEDQNEDVACHLHGGAKDSETKLCCLKMAKPHPRFEPLSPMRLRLMTCGSWDPLPRCWGNCGWRRPGGLHSTCEAVASHPPSFPTVIPPSTHLPSSQPSSLPSSHLSLGTVAPVAASGCKFEPSSLGGGGGVPAIHTALLPAFLLPAFPCGIPDTRLVRHRPSRHRWPWLTMSCRQASLLLLYSRYRS